MKWLVSTALRIRFIVVALAVVLVLIASQNLSNAPLDVFPEFAPPKVEIQTEVPGLSASEVEALVTVPIESSLNGVAWLDTMRSKSVLGLSSIVLFFDRGTDLLKARQLVQERVAQAARQLPETAHPPVILSPLSSTSRVLKIGLQSDQFTQMEMTTLALWTVRPKLMAVPGVANVAIWGQRDRQIQVQVDPNRLNAYGLSIDDVTRATKNAVAVSGGSFIEGPNQRFNVTHLPAILSPDDLKSIVIDYRNGAGLTLGQVADIVEGSAPPIGDGIINDKPGLLLIVEKQPWGNTLDVTRGVEKSLESLKPALNGIDVDSTIFRPATYIENSLANLNTALLIGCVLVILVLTFFLYEWRAALISIVAIPLSLLTAGMILNYTGGVINTMVLAGLVIALGEVVDDAIIDVENILRRLRINRTLPNPASVMKVVLDASVEVRTAVVFGSVIVVVVLIPVFMLDGLSGTFFRPLAFSYVTAILASLVVALIITPVLSLFLLPRAAEKRHEDSPLVRWLKKKYRPMLEKTVRRPGRGLAGLTGALIAVLVIYPFLNQELLPNFKEYDFLMHWLERPGTSLDAMNRVTIRASKELRSVEGVRNFGAHVGRAEVADEVVGIDFTELWISLDPSVPYDATVEKIQGVVDGYPGLFRDLLTYLRERIKEVLSGTSASIVVRIYGPDFDKLISTAHDVEHALSEIKGVRDLSVQHLTYIPQISLRFKPEQAAALGITPKDVRDVTNLLLSGQKVGEVFQEQKSFAVVVRGTPKYLSSLEALRNASIRTKSGTMVPLKDVTEIFTEPTPNKITRESASRYINVTLNPSGRSLDAVAKDVKSAISRIQFEHGYYPEMLGEFKELKEAQSRLLIAGLVSVTGIFLIFLTVFQSLRIAGLMFLGLPAALIGSIIGVLLTGGTLSLGSLIGFITVIGISTRNGLMMISHFRHLEQEEGMPFGEDLVLRGAQERLSPILMTALTTGLALLPLIVSGVRPGQEIEHPMAVVILGGLLSSAALNLFLLPSIYLKFGRSNERETNMKYSQENPALPSTS